YPSGAGTQGYWQRLADTGAISTTNLTDDILIGGTATDSAKFAFINNAGGTPTASISGNLALAAPLGADPSTSLNIYNGGSFNILTSPGGDTGLISRFTVTNDGNVGIGDTSPT